MKEQLVQALKSKYGADYQMHKANLDIYLNNPVGIGEHPQHFEEMDKLVCSMASSKDNLMTLDDEYGEGNPQILNESYGGTD